MSRNAKNTFRKHRHRTSRRRLTHEPLESRLVMAATGLPGNPFSPDLDLTAIDTQPIRAGEELVLDLRAAGGTVTDLDANGNSSGDIVRFQLDPDDTPTGATITTSGVFRWTPDASQIGRFEFVVIAVDSGSPPLADAEVFFVEVAANVAPDLAAIQDAVVSVNEMYEVTVTAVDFDGDNMTFLLDRDDPDSTLPDNAVLEQLNNNAAVIRWTPDAADAGGTFDFSVLVVDDGFPALSDRETFSVSVMSVAAVPDTYAVAVDGQLAIDAAAGVLANDTDSDGDVLAATVLANPANGSLSLATDGSFTYMPNTSFRGTDTFTYRAEDGSGDVAQAVVTIRVNSAPAAADDAYSTDEDTTLAVDAMSGVLNNDSDADGDALTLSLVEDPANGTLALNADGSFLYTPSVNFHGTDSFKYRVSDGIVDSGEVTVTIAVSAANDAPVAGSDSYSVEEDITLTVPVETGVLVNDGDVDGDPLTVTLMQGATSGTVALNGDGSFTYTPNSDFHGSDSFAYVANDGTADSVVATVSITVNPINDEPQASADTYSATEDSTLNIDVASGVLANDTDTDGDSLTATLIDDVMNGTLTLNADGSFTYTPNTDFAGTDSFNYSASDGLAASTVTLVTITVVEQNAFNIVENSAPGTVVGTVTPEGELGANVVYSINDPNLAEALELAADDHIKGSPAGSVVVIEYLDFQCPTCQAYHPIIEQLLLDFPDDVMVVSRHLPLESIHQNAFAAAVAAEAAGRQGNFDAFGDLLFTNQDDWANAADPTSFFETYATQLGLDIDLFRADVADPDLADRVNRDANAAAGLGATGTPTFFLNGQQLAELPSQSEFASLIQAEVDASTDVFAVNRLTGEITVRDSATLDFETNPSFVLTIKAVGLSASETIVATINLVDQAEAEGEGSLNPLDEAFAGEDDWLNPLAESP